MTESENNLELVDTDELLAELSNRFDGCVFLGTKKETDSGGTYLTWFDGGTAIAVGLCEVGKAKFLQMHIEAKDME